jgi:Protein of unknown function (DUF2946)
MNARKTIRLLEVLVAVTTLLVFTIVVSSALHHHDSVDDSHCPYCHMGHQSAAQPESGQRVAVLSLLASLPLPEDVIFAASRVFPHTATRAPPFA